LKLKVIVGLHC